MAGNARCALKKDTRDVNTCVSRRFQDVSSYFRTRALSREALSRKRINKISKVLLVYFHVCIEKNKYPFSRELLRARWKKKKKKETFAGGKSLAQEFKEGDNKFAGSSVGLGPDSGYEVSKPRIEAGARDFDRNFEKGISSGRDVRRSARTVLVADSLDSLRRTQLARGNTEEHGQVVPDPVVVAVTVSE